jgi:hypothetical protein
MNHDLWLEAMKTMKTIFEKHSIHYWLDRGTLLGAIRHGDFIPWDTDVDMGLWYNTLLPVFNCKSDFDKTPFELYYTNGHFSIRSRETKEHIICLLLRDLHDGKYQWTYFYPPFTFLVFLLEANDSVYNEDSIRKFKPNLKPFVSLFKHIPKSGREFIERQIFKLQVGLRLFRRFNKASASSFRLFDKIVFKGEKFPVPYNSDIYLYEFFGPNWKTPIFNKQVVTEWEGKPVKVIV